MPDQLQASSERVIALLRERLSEEILARAIAEACAHEAQAKVVELEARLADEQRSLETAVT